MRTQSLTANSAASLAAQSASALLPGWSQPGIPAARSQPFLAGGVETLPATERPQLVALRFDPMAAYLTFALKGSVDPDEFTLNGVTLPKQGCYPFCWHRNGDRIEAIVPRDMVPYCYFSCAFRVDPVAKWKRYRMPDRPENIRGFIQ